MPDLRRREFITLLGDAAAWPLAARRRDFIKVIASSAIAWPLAGQAQQAEEVHRISVFEAFDAIDPQKQRRMLAFLQSLQGLGWIEGGNVRIEYRWGGTDPERVRSVTVELVKRKPDVILASGSFVVRLLQRETQTIPIVFTQVADPVANGFVASLAHPGGNITGLTSAAYPAGADRSLELLTSVAPRIGHATIVLNPDQASHAGIRHAIEAAARPLNVQTTSAEVRTAADITRAIEASGHEPNGGLIVLPSPITTVHRTLIVELAARRRLPAIYPYRADVVSGGLMSYGADPVDQHRRAASYVDRILRGAKPADLPVEQPNRFELVINLKTAKALGLEIPATVLARADEVIE
jgi:putative tryptophan/tyrosine transport system substrate-binding protein